MPDTKNRSNILINPSHIPAADRALQYGDACFTSMYAQDGKILLLPEHIQRLQYACDILAIAFEDWLLLQNEIAKCEKEVQAPTVIKVMITRGIGGRGYMPPPKQHPQCIISTHATEAILPPKTLFTLGFSDVTLFDDGLKGVKHANRLTQVRASDQNARAGVLYNELLLCDVNDHVIECSSANIFYRLGGVWYTPPMRELGVKGIMRDALMRFMKEQYIPVFEATHHKSQFQYVDAMLLSNAVKGVRLVKSLQKAVKQPLRGDEQKRFIDLSESLETLSNDIVHPFYDKILGDNFA
uniref:aminodeoxychorismate lyase n=1 Tax=Ningiella ruwaisensis TaxID=2364274 RepID=UPI0010A062CA|nr:aminodeoxychorismate lyase [Ningiella ruwaisensis]